MVEQARRLNPDISFREGNMMALSLEDRTFAGIAAFYAIVNIPQESLPLVFQEMARVLQPGGLLLLAFHTGDEVVQEKELWGRPISMDFFLFQPSAIREFLELAGFGIEGIIEREPYMPEVEYQSRRAYIFARKPAPRHNGKDNFGVVRLPQTFDRVSRKPAVPSTPEPRARSVPCAPPYLAETTLVDVIPNKTVHRSEQLGLIPKLASLRQSRRSEP
jgi:SAM-dependent methyltransferase